MAISKQLVELMNGKISVTSQPGIGSSFYVTIQVPIITKTLPENVRAIDMSAVHCLVIDRNLLLRDTLCQCLDNWVTSSLASDSLQSGIHQFQQKYAPSIPPFIIIDQKILEEEQDYFQTLKSTYPALNIVCLTPTSSHRSGQEGPLDTPYIPKPVTRKMLKSSIEECLSRPEHAPKANTFLGEENPKSLVNETPGPGTATQENGLTLYVDDNFMNRKVVSEMLAILGQSFILAQNGQEAIELVKMRKPNLILMDISMPVIDGYQATQIIRSEQSNAQYPKIVGLTAHVMPEDCKKCLEAGMDDFLPKPVTLQMLRSLFEEQ